jgi:hypothetical protein
MVEQYFAEMLHSSITTKMIKTKEETSMQIKKCCTVLHALDTIEEKWKGMWKKSDELLLL